MQTEEMRSRETFTLAELEKMMEESGGLLNLRGCTSLTKLPDGLTVSGWLHLSGCTSITKLPDGLAVGKSLDLRGCTSLTTLPEGLAVGSSLYLSGCTSLTTLPDGLAVGSLDLSGCTSLTKLPDGLAVGKSLDLRGCTIKNPREYHRLQNGDYVPGRYIYADDILTHVKREKKLDGYTYYVGKFKGKDVITDGELYAHCSSFAEGVSDIAFKRLKSRGEQQYADLTLESVVMYEDAVAMYRIITGACKSGTQHFIDGLSRDDIKESYTVQEIVEMTRGQYGAATFENFFKKGKNHETFEEPGSGDHRAV